MGKSILDIYFTEEDRANLKLETRNWIDALDLANADTPLVSDQATQKRLKIFLISMMKRIDKLERLYDLLSVQVDSLDDEREGAY